MSGVSIAEVYFFASLGLEELSDKGRLEVTDSSTTNCAANLSLRLGQPPPQVRLETLPIENAHRTDTVIPFVIVGRGRGS